MTLAQENVVLSLFGTAPDGLTSVEMQKLMFLISQDYAAPLYEFIPFEQGCYSPTLAADVHIGLCRFSGEYMASRSRIPPPSFGSIVINVPL